MSISLFFSSLLNPSRVFGVTLILSLVIRESQCAPVIDYEYSCNICRDPTVGVRELVSVDKSFTQESNGVTMTCGQLQESVQDVRLSGGGPEEEQLCKTAQYLAWYYGCECSGPNIPSPDDIYVDPNPACDLCAGQDFDFVPEPNKGKLTQTECCGRMNCEILYFGAAEGVLDPSMCVSMQQSSGAACCNLDPITPTDEEEQEPRDEEICVGVYGSCSISDPEAPTCCDGLKCRARSIGAEPVCSAQSKKPRERISNGESRVGGANRRGRVRGSS